MIWGAWEDYTINVSNSLAVATITKDQVQLYPNPTKGNLQVTGITPAHVKVFGIDGKLIPARYEGNVIDTHKLTTGAYVIQITDKEGNTVSKRFVKE